MGNGQYDIAIIGGGLAGLVSAIELAGAGLRVVLFERKEYPYHKVCGEYVSNEVLPYLQSLGFDPFHFGAVPVSRLRVCDTGGQELVSALPLGAFGISRYTLDAALAKLSVKKGAVLKTNTRVTDVQAGREGFSITTDQKETFSARLVIGAWGKRDVLDKKLSRPFMQEHTGYMGVKYHIRGDLPEDEIGLYLFDGGYCGVSGIEDRKFNLCYLYRRGKLPFKSIPELEEKALYSNPKLRRILESATRVFEAPEVINEISFASKKTVEGGIIMCGDSAGLITPLCGNGMAMAIRSARMLSECILAGDDFRSEASRAALNQLYSERWDAAFRSRLQWGRRLQGLFYNKPLVAASLNLLKPFPGVQRWLVRQTHGEVMKVRPLTPANG